MTDQERFVRTLSFQSVDRVPRCELALWGQTFERWLGEGLPPDAIPGSDFFPGSEFFGLDRRDFIPVHTGILPGYGYEVLEETDRYVIARHDHGGVTKGLKTGTVRGTRLSMDQHLRAPVTDMDTFRDYQSRLNPDSPARYPGFLASRAREWNARDCSLQLLTNGAFGFYSHARTMMDTEGLSLAFHEQPALVRAIMDHLEHFITTIIEKVFASGVRVDVFNFFEDMAYKTAPLLSPATFREFLFPGLKRVIAGLHEAGLPVIKHTDGMIRPLLEMILDSGIDCLDPIDPIAGMDIEMMKKQYGDRIALKGNVDCAHTLTFGTEKEVVEETKEVIRKAAGGGGLILSSSNSIHSSVKPGNYLAMWNAVRMYGKYPLSLDNWADSGTVEAFS